MPSEQIGSAFVTIGLDTKGLESGLNAAKSSVASATTDMSGMGQKISDGLKNVFTKDKGDFQNVGKDLGNSLTQGLEQRFGALGGAAGSLASALGPIGVAGLAVGAALAGGFVLAINAAREWEAGMAGVGKTTGLAGDDLKGLSDELLAMSTRMPTAAADLQAIAGVAGSLGVAKQDIAGFTEVASQMAVGFEMPAEVAATSAAKILTAFGKPIDASNMLKLGNVVNTMGDNFAATEPQVLDFINRASFLQTTMGVAIPEVAALGTTLISVGLDAEVAATGIKSALNMGLSETSKTGGITNWAKLMGVSIDELKGKISGDFSGTMVETANKIAGMSDPVARFQMAVALFGSEGAPAVLKLAGQTDNLNKALSTANSEWANGSSLQKTYATQCGTLNSQFSIFSNTMKMVLVSVGTPMLPWVSAAVGALQQLAVAGFNAGAAIVSIVQNSNAFSALTDAIGEIGNVVSTTFGNFVSVVEPAWDALGGGTTVMKVLQAAFNAATMPITAMFTVLSAVVGILGKVASAISPVASAIGGALATAIKTTSAYVTAFIEAFSNLGPIKTFQSVIQGAADIAGKVWDGLSTAVPNAFNAAFDAVKTLVTGFISWVGDSLGVGNIGTKITDGIKNSLGEGITGWIGSISGRANELLGAGEDIAKPVAEGVKTDEELQKAAAEALNTPEALAAAEKAGGEIADKTLSGFAQQAKLSGLGDEAMLAMINGQSAGDSRIKTAVFSLYGKTVKYWYDAADKNPITHLSIDDKMVFNKSKGGGQTWTAAQVLDMLGLPQPEKIEEVAKMEGRTAEAAIISVREAAKAATGKGIFDFTPAKANLDSFSSQLSSQLQGLVTNVGRQIESLGNAPAYDATKAIWKKEGQDLIDALAEPIGVQGFAKVKAALTGISDWTSVWAGTYGETAADAAKEYKDNLVAGISDMGPYVSQEMGRIGTEAATAIEDGFLSIDDKALLDSLLAQAEILKEVAPAEYEAVGGDLVVALINGIKDGDIAGPAAAKANEAMDAIKTTLSEGASIENFGALGEQYYSLAQAMGSRWTEGMQEDAEASMEQYKELLSGAITDIGAFTADAMELAGSTASAAFSDNVFTSDDLVKLQTNLLPMLEMVEETSPEYFESAAGKAWLAFEEAIKSGDPDEIYKKFKELGTVAGDGFLSGVKKSVSLQEIYNLLKADPTKLKTLISDPVKYAWTDGIDGAKKAIDAERDELSTGLIDAATARENILNAFSPLKDVLPGWVNNLTEDLANGKITLGEYLSEFEKNYKVLEDYRKKTEESTTATEKSTKATKEKTAALDENKLSLKSLNDEIKTTKELSGAGLTITFAPARVIAEEAKNALVLGAQIASGFITGGGNAVKIGFDQWGREVAVIGKVAQDKWAKNGELISANIKTSSDTAATTTTTAATDGKNIHIAGMTDGNALFLQNARQINAEDKIAHDKINLEFTTKFGSAASGFLLGVGGAISNLAQKLGLASDGFFSKTTFAGLDLSNKTTSAATIAYGKQINAADYGLTKSYSGSNLLQNACQTGANALTTASSYMVDAATQFKYNSLSDLPSSSGYTAPSSGTGTGTGTGSGGSSVPKPKWGPESGLYGWGQGYAEGTKTSGPQLAMIGEDGPQNPEYVIPTKTKRWDLLLAAMRSYGLGSILRTLGIRGFAGGTSTGNDTGGVSADNGEASGVTATFGITGLAAMSKQVQKIINNLKDFFRISWAIVKSEASTYWRQINTVLTTEITSIRDMGWQAAIDIRNVWIASNAEIKGDALAFWAGYWSSIEPSVSSLKSSLVSAFQSMGSDAKSAIDNMVLNSESSLQSFESAWSDIWAQLVSDMNDAQAKISEGISTISDALKKISVNVNINANISSGGSSGGSYSGSNAGEYGEWSPTDGGWLQGTGDMGSTYNISTGGGGCAIGTNCASGGCPDYMTAVQSSTGSLATAGLGYTGGTYESRASSYTMPAIFAAKGALVDQPTKAILAEAGPEMVLPTKLTKMFLSLADMGFGQGGRSASERIVIEDHTEHHWYMDGKEVTDALMTRVMKKMQLKGAVSAR